MNFKTLARTKIKFNASHRFRWARATSGVKGVTKNKTGARESEEEHRGDCGGLKNAVASSQQSSQGLPSDSRREREEGDSGIVFC